MGYSLTWLAFKDMSADEACAAFAAERTGEPVRRGTADLMGVALPGWYVIVVDNRGKYELEGLDFAVDKPQPNEVVSFDVTESTGYYRLQSHVMGELRWSLWLHSLEGPDLHVEGDLPLPLAEIRTRLRERLKREFPNAALEADDQYDQELPAELGLALTGFHHEDGDLIDSAEVLRLPKWAEQEEARAAEQARMQAYVSEARARRRPWWKFW